MCRVFQRVRAVSRATLRMIWLTVEIIRGAAAYRCRALGTSDVRARWLHEICRRVLRVFGVQSVVTGPIPARGLLVANHLSYLDIVLLGALAPCVFVAKTEVKGWPVFGWFARLAGTIFVNRSRRRDAARANELIRFALRGGALVVLFPEGTSSDGARVLPFKSSLLESVAGERVPVSVAALRYELPDGDAGTEVCYWGEHTLGAHLLNLISKRQVKASVAFQEVPNTWRDRKKLAGQLHAEVSALHAELGGLSIAVGEAPSTSIANDGEVELANASAHRLFHEMAS
jgi:1-acyl-sn-glycerol-3-phosphate acyltransferase